MFGRFFTCNSISSSLSFSNVSDFWINFITTDSVNIALLEDSAPVISDTISELTNFVSIEDVLKHYPDIKSAMSPNGMSLA